MTELQGYSPKRCCERDRDGDGNCDRHPVRRPLPPTGPTCLPPPPIQMAEYIAARELHAAHLASQRCGIREGESLAELITRLYAETLADKP